MNKLIIAGAAGALLAGSAFAGNVAMAGEPVTLSDAQMDTATAGWSFRLGAGGGASYLGDAKGGKSARTRTSVGGGFYEGILESYDTGGRIESVLYTTEASGFATSNSTGESGRRDRRSAYATSGVNWAGGVYIEAYSGGPN